MTSIYETFSQEVAPRLKAIDELAASGGLDEAVNLIANSLQNDGVIQAFGTGHSAAFAMEMAGRAGGFIPSHRINLDDVAIYGSRPVSEIGTAELERGHEVADELWDLYNISPNDVLLIASNSGANGSTVGLALRAKQEGIPVIAVTSLEHSNGVESKHPSGKRLYEVADVAIDNLAPYGDGTIEVADGINAGPVSSITAAYIAQLMTLGAADKLRQAGGLPPMYISANIPTGDAHNIALQDRYAGRIRSYALKAQPDVKASEGAENK